MNHVILFGDGVTTLSTAWCLREFPITLISSVNQPSLARYSRFVQGTLRLSSNSPEELFRALERLRERYHDLLLVPCSDRWIEAFVQNFEQVKKFGSILPNVLDHMELSTDKIRFGQRLQQLQLPAPTVFTFQVTPKWCPADYPFVLKPSSTYQFEAEWGVKALLVRNEVEWKLIDRDLFHKKRFLAQEFLDGDPISVCFCTTKDSKLATAYATRKVNFPSMGAGTRVRTIRCPEALELAAEFTSRLGFVGFGELEMIATRRGLALLELNARPWNQVAMSRVLGFDILGDAVRLMRGEERSGGRLDRCGELEWIAWDQDLLLRRAMRKPTMREWPSVGTKRVYAISAFRDPIPTLAYYARIGRLALAKLLKRILHSRQHKVPAGSRDLVACKQILARTTLPKQ
jgi:predicted ATP-grasp superfamily ATP-dependent carboligase